MSVESVLDLNGYSGSYLAIIEPWGEEFRIDTDERCKLVAIHPKLPASFEVSWNAVGLIVWINQHGATFEFWRGASKEFSMPVPSL